MIDDGYTFVESSIATTGYSEALANLIECEMASGLFTNEGSRRVRLHVIRRVLSNRNQEAQSNVNRDTLQVGDVIILNVRHEAIDGISIKYFLDDLAEGYTNKHLSDQDDNITYLDYTVYERLNDHSASVAFWKDHRGNLDCSKFMARFPYDQP
ncbi:unnamed protein product [Adineta ricciae]|uniref:Uncharacterized protein n=1 Tax=Adineta ricciae TaxID=249248 RepID=A0A815TKL3_ADIRI|nr:unnamed protein product [Adineta ricciae]CAF1656311.1 unnamed protein product [Adineta ricciae]